QDVGRQVLQEGPAPAARPVPCRSSGPRVTAAAADTTGARPPAGDVLDRDAPPVLGANPFVGLTRRQVGAALGRLMGRVAVEPGVLVEGALGGGRQLVAVGM